jgi:hypothetical protein
MATKKVTPAKKTATAKKATTPKAKLTRVEKAFKGAEAAKKNLPTVEVVKQATKKAAKEIAAEITKPTGIVKQIIALYKKGKTQKEIIAAGFNKSTVYRQVLVYRTQNGLD